MWLWSGQMGKRKQEWDKDRSRHKRLSADEGPGRKPRPRHAGGRSVPSGGRFSASGGTARPARSPFWVESGSCSQHVLTEATYRLSLQGHVVAHPAGVGRESGPGHKRVSAVR